LNKAVCVFASETLRMHGTVLYEALYRSQFVA